MPPPRRLRAAGSTVVLPLFLLAYAALFSYCQGNRSRESVDTQGRTVGVAGEWFSEVSKDVGLEFVHFNGMSGQFYPPEIMAPGVALFDFDNDGDLDVFVVQGRALNKSGRTRSADLAQSNVSRARLFRNDLNGGVLKFTDVTETSGLNVENAP